MLEHLALSMAAKKFITITAGGAIAASAAVYATGDVRTDAEAAVRAQAEPVTQSISLQALPAR